MSKAVVTLAEILTKSPWSTPETPITLLFPAIFEETLPVTAALLQESYISYPRLMLSSLKYHLVISAGNIIFYSNVVYAYILI